MAKHKRCTKKKTSLKLSRRELIKTALAGTLMPFVASTSKTSNA